MISIVELLLLLRVVLLVLGEETLGKWRDKWGIIGWVRIGIHRIDKGCRGDDGGWFAAQLDHSFKTVRRDSMLAKDGIGIIRGCE